MNVAVEGGGAFEDGAAHGVDITLDGAEDNDGLGFDAGFDAVFPRDDDSRRADDFALDAAGHGAFVGEFEGADDFDVRGYVPVVLRRRGTGHRRRGRERLGFSGSGTIGQDGRNGAPFGPTFLPAKVFRLKIPRAEEDGEFLRLVRPEGLPIFGDEEGHAGEEEWCAIQGSNL